MALLGALDVETHEVRSALRARAAALSLTPVLQSVAETLLGELIAGGVIKPTDVALAGGANGAACNARL